MGFPFRLGLAAAIVIAAQVCTAAWPGAGQAAPAQAPATTLTGRVVDENGAPVSGARIFLTHEARVSRAESGEAGSFELSGLDATAAYELRVEKAGFYVLVNHEFHASPGVPVDLILNHRQEYEEKVDVHYAAPAIDLQKLPAGAALDATAIVDIPYSSSHEFRNGLALLPGVLQDNQARIHLNGGAEDQVLYTLDGFNLTDPFDGKFENRIPVDGIREVNIDSSRYAAEFGKSSAGTLAVQSAAGDDAYRYGLTNFIPSGQLGGAGVLSKWTPRATISGPWRRARAWFFNATDAQYNITQVDELPKGANRDTRWGVNDLLRNQFLLGRSTLVGATLLWNYLHENNYGLGALSPLETTLEHNERNYLFALRSQHFRKNGALYELAFAASRLSTRDDPRGTATFLLTPDGIRGNYFERSHLTSHRWQTLADVVLPPATWHGRQEWKVGADLDWVGFDRLLERRPFDLLRGDGTLWRRTQFLGPSSYGSGNFEQSLYAQDHWVLGKRVVFELGLRQDWNRRVRQAVLSPRLALAVAPFGDDRTKLTVGWGIFYDTASLQALTHNRDLDRQDFYYSNDGTTLVAGPRLRRWVVPGRGLRLPRSSNSSLGVERKLPAGFYLRAGYIRRRTSHGLAFLAPPLNGTYLLGNGRHDRYDAFQIGLEHGLGKGYTWMAAYTRSAARSDAALDLAPTDPLFGIQGPGPLGWDTPNRLLSRAWIPIGSKHGLAYVVEWRSGYPFSAFSEDAGLVGPPNSYRYPNYFSLNLEAERVFHFRKYRWGFRAGFVNISNHKNPNAVNNMLESPNFLGFAGGQRRAFVTRIRLIGKD
jgi:hypothetical protein